METKDIAIKCKFTYQCGICGKSYDNVLERAKCEIKCNEKVEAEAKKIAEAKKKEEQKMRKEVIDETLVRLHGLITKYVNDYGYYEYGDGNGEIDFHWSSKLFHNFLA